MDYLEQLRNGSKFHKVAPIQNGFKIYAAFDDEECIEKFHNIVVEAIEHAAGGGYEIEPHSSAEDPERRYDLATITFTSGAKP